MSDEITPEIFNHLVELAALELDETQAEYLRRQLNNQLKAIHELEAIPLDPATPIALHGVSYSAAVSPALRPDEYKAFPDREDILSQVPQIADSYIVVPETPHITLE
jgi:aspartyl-tRNA(Asn)/glutamyl-tRNA(Gln) amidotransferase subunit C